MLFDIKQFGNQLLETKFLSFFMPQGAVHVIESSPCTSDWLFLAQYNEKFRSANL